MTDNFCKKSNIFILLGYFYTLLPILIFFIGYCRLPIAIVGTILILFSSYFLFKNAPKIWIPQNKKEWLTLGVILFIIILWVCYSGIGAISYQTPDHNCRNPIFELLVTQKWPVMVDSNILTYYIGFWLPPAIIGKIFNSVSIGYYAQIVWAVFGIFLFVYYVLAIFRKKLFIPFILFIFFSGLDYLGCCIADFYRSGIYLMLRNAYIVSHLEWYLSGLQFSSFTTQLYWVFNQAIPIWVITMLLWHEKNNKNLIFIYSCSFISSTLPAMGLFPLVIYWYFKNGRKSIKSSFKKNRFLRTIKNGITLQNVIGALIIVPISYVYLSGNITGHNVYVDSVSSNHNGLFYMTCRFMMFFMLEVGLYLMFLWKKHKCNFMFYIIILCFIIYPHINIGTNADFCMRATIPALIILFIYVVDLFYDKKFLTNKLAVYALICILLIGSMTPIHEIGRSILLTAEGYKKRESALGFANFFAYGENNKFLKYIAKNQKAKN